MLLRGTGLPFDLLDGRFDQLAMTFAVKAFADDPAHRLDDDVRHLQANRLNGPLALSIDVPACRRDDAPRLFAGLLLSLLLNSLGGPVRLLDDSPRLFPGPEDLGLGGLEPLFSFFARLLCLFQLLLDLLLPRFRGSNDRWVDPPRENPQHQQEGEDLGDQGAVDIEQPCLEIDEQWMQAT